jgi:hypothetical protein
MVPPYAGGEASASSRGTDAEALARFFVTVRHPCRVYHRPRPTEIDVATATMIDGSGRS